MGSPASPLEKRRVTISKRQKMQREILLTELRKNSVMTVACQKAGIPRSTVYRWMNNDSGFSDAIEEASTEGRDIINDMAESVLIKKIREENLAASKYWLSNNHERYRLWKSRITDSITRREIERLKESFKNFFDGVFGKNRKK
jgi:hypothetical protein